MNRWKAWLSMLLAALLALGCCGALAETATVDTRLTLEDIAAFGATAYAHDGRVTFVDGACTDGAVRSREDAAAVVSAMVGLLGGDDRTQFEPWRDFSDTAGNRYYVFQQMYAETTVSGGAVKVVTDASGNMLGLVGSVETELPDAAQSEGISAAAAEALVLQRLADADQGDARLLEGLTQKVILPVNLELDPDSEEEKEESRFVWGVYTDNPRMSREVGLDLPYLAHYVTLDGEYLYNLPTVIPGDVASVSGFDAAYVFEFMEPAEYTGTVTMADGSQREISVTLMRDARTGMYYMGNVERRIAVADCYEFIYNQGRVVLEASADNTGWDDSCLMAFENYCRAWDNYREIGWTGGDGLGTPMLILKDFCNRDHEPQDNAAYAGKYYGWQIFLSSSINNLAQCADVIAHEFTHCVTGSVMTYNAYMNDFGAINEAMSDIQGNVCEMLSGATDDTTWALGEIAGEPVRSMSDPHRYRQPENAWDIYYVPKVKTPTDINDRGGVHSNSSLLNNIAYRLCADGGMSLEEARAYWFAVDCSMVPGTDYAQLSELLPWVMKNLGMEAYLTTLERAMDATRISTDAIPDAFDENRALVTLTLPEGEMYEDGNWALLIVSVNVESIEQRGRDILERNGEYADALDGLMDILGLDPALLPSAEEIKQDGERAWDRLRNSLEAMLSDEDGALLESILESDEISQLPGKLLKWWYEYFSDLVYAGNGVAGQDGRTVRMVCRPGWTVPVLYRLEIDSEMNVKSVGLAIYAMRRWIDVGALIAPLLEIDVSEPVETELPETAEFSWLSDLLDDSDDTSAQEDSEPPAWMTGALEQFVKSGWLRDLLFFKIAPGGTTTVPDSGLEALQALDAKDFPVIDEIFSMSAPTAEEDAAGEAPAE